MRIDKKMQEAANLLKNVFEKKLCLAGDEKNCSEKIINSHAISACFLKNIAEDSHVITPEGDFFIEMGRWKLISTGIKKTKAFKGFCSYHDNKLFSSFEKHKFLAGKQQLLDLSLRSVCRELYQKKCSIYFINELASKYPDSNLKHTKNDYLNHTQQMIRSLKYLQNGIQRKFKFLTFVIKTTPVPINTAGVMFPTHTWNKEPIQFKRRTKHGFIYNLITLEDCSYFIVSTLESKHSNVDYKFMSSLENMPNNEQLISYLIQSFLFFNDIFVIKPSWYHNQNESTKSYIEEVMNIQYGNYTGFNYVTSVPNFVPLFDDFKILDKNTILY